MTTPESSGNDRPDELASAIIAVIKDGFPIDPEMMRQIESLLGFVKPNELKHILSAPSDPDTEVIGELVVYPDLSQRLRIEPFIPRKGLSQTEFSLLESAITGNREMISRIFSVAGAFGDFYISLNPEWIHYLLSRFRLDYGIPDFINDLHADFSFDARKFLRVFFRTHRTPFLAHQVEAWQILFRNILDFNPADRVEDNEILFRFNAIMDRFQPEETLFNRFLKEKVSAVERINRIHQTLRMISTQSMEQIVLSGSRVMLEDPDSASADLITLDRLSVLMFGQVLHPDLPATRSYSPA